MQEFHGAKTKYTPQSFDRGPAYICMQHVRVHNSCAYHVLHIRMLRFVFNQIG